MLAADQSYSRLFRPWDVTCDSEDSNTKTDVYNSLSELKKFNETFERVHGKLPQKVNPKNKDELKTKKTGDRESRLRKIRGQNRKGKLHLQQDATISTTTLENDPQMVKSDIQNFQKICEDPVKNLSEICNRLVPRDDDNEKKPTLSKRSKTITKRTAEVITKDSSCNMPYPLANELSNVPLELLPYPPEYLPTHPNFVPELTHPQEIAHALGIPSTDPLFLESLAQGYAMELEYARIMHQENQNKLLNARKQRPKKYKCPHCHVGFSNNGQLKGHVRIHTGERPYKCEETECGKTFTRNEELTRHKRIHTGLRPYPCPTCGKKFGRRDHLKKHTRTHLAQAERMMPLFVPLSAVPHLGAFPYLYAY